MGKTINQFLGLDSRQKRADGTEMSHNEKYETIVRAVGLATLIPFIPATEEKVAKAYAEDRHLNNIPIKLWDDQHQIVGRLMARNAGITSSSLAERVCVLKCAARMWIGGNE